MKIDRNIKIGKNQELSSVVIIIYNDNSFTYNLVQYLEKLVTEFPVASGIKVFRNDKITIHEIRPFKPDGIVISSENPQLGIIV